MTQIKGHWRIPYKSAYLAASDLNEPRVLTISHVVQEKNANQPKGNEVLNVAYFVEKELHHGYKLKPMVLNVTNAKTIMGFCGGSRSVHDWVSVSVTVYAQQNVRMRDGTTGEGLRIDKRPPRTEKPELVPGAKTWNNAVAAYRRDGNLNKVLERCVISKENQELIIQEATA